MDIILVTADAGSAENLTDDDYRDIYNELRSKCPLRQFAELINSQVVFSWWSKYERHEAHLTRERRQELRRAVGLPALPPLVAEAVVTADENASVWQIGAGRADCIIMVSDRAREPLAFRLNGDLHVTAGAENSDETVVTPPQTGATKETRLRVKPRYYRPCLSLEPGERVDQLRRLLAAAEAEIGGRNPPSP